MKENRKKTIRISILILILLIGIGYAALKATLKVNGTVNIDKATWDVHFENVEIAEGSVTANPAPTSNNVDTTEINYTINFTKPGDFFEFTVDMVNKGTIDVMVNSVTNKAYNVTGTTEIETPTYLINTVAYDDDIEIAPNHLLEAGKSEKIKVRVEFKKDIEISDLPSDGDTSIVFKFIGDYKQADENAISMPQSFETDSWETIANNTTSSKYKVGDEKTIQMDLDGDNINENYVLRIANTSTPTECFDDSFSQSACGFVIEFKKIITQRRINPSTGSMTNGDGNYGGWKYSELRAFVNSEKYLEGETNEIDYIDNGIYNKLPPELKNRIIDTKVISGHGLNESTNFVTTDKLYIVNIKELNGDDRFNYDTSSNFTRQLDYYKKIGVTSEDINNSPATKEYSLNNTSDWWTRTPAGFFSFKRITSSGGIWGGGSNDSTERNIGVSPAFRIG